MTSREIIRRNLDFTGPERIKAEARTMVRLFAAGRRA